MGMSRNLGEVPTWIHTASTIWAGASLIEMKSAQVPIWIVVMHKKSVHVPNWIGNVRREKRAFRKCAKEIEQVTTNLDRVTRKSRQGSEKLEGSAI